MPVSRAILTLDEARTYLGAEDTVIPSARLQMLVDSATLHLEAYLQNAVVEGTFTEKRWGGTKQWFLSKYPIQSITSIADPAANTILATDYTIIEDEGRLIPFGRFATAVATDGRRERWLITYVAGRFATTDAVDQNFKMAANILVADRFARPGSGVVSKQVGDLKIQYSDPSSSRAEGAATALVPDSVRQLVGHFVSRQIG